MCLFPNLYKNDDTRGIIENIWKQQWDKQWLKRWIIIIYNI